MKKSGYLLTVSVKLLISGGLLYWLLKDAEFSVIFETIRHANPWLLGLAFCMFFLGYFITAFRWQTLLRSQGHDAPLMPLVRSFMVALFFNNFLPSTIGGDVIRMYDSWKIMRKKSEAFAVIFIDRFFGITALLCYALIALLLMQRVADMVPVLRPVLIAAFLFAAVVIFVVFSKAGYLAPKAEAWQEGHPNPVLRLVGKLLRAFAVYSGKTTTLVKVFVLSLLLQLNVILHFTVIALALGIDVPLIAMFVIIPVATVVMMLPVSINGIGLREAVFVLFFGIFGVTNDQSIAFAWVAYSFVLVQGLLGGLVFAVRLLKTDDTAAGNEKADNETPA